jgi:hypothetical protein
MRTRVITATLLVASMASVGAAASAQTSASKPAWIQSGACDAAGLSVATLTDLTGSAVGATPAASPLPVGLSSAVPVSSSVTTVPISLADLVATGHSLVVARSAADPTIIACGDIGGRVVGDLPIGLASVADSGLNGVATFHDGGDGTTIVVVYLLGSGGAAAPSPSPAPAATTVTLGQSLYYAGLDIMVEDATYDPEAGTLTLNVTYQNTGTAETHLESLSGGRVWVGWDQTVINMPAPSGIVPAGTTVPGTISGSVPAGFVMEDAVLTFGLPGDHQATLPLAAGSTATSEQPVVLDVKKKVRARKYATFQVTGVQVVPALCSGSWDGFVFTPAPINEASIVVTLNVSGGTAIGVGGLGLGGSFAQGPDGLSGPGSLGTPVLGPRQAFRAVNYCFPVTSPVHGKHVITFLTDPAKASLTLNVP